MNLGVRATVGKEYMWSSLGLRLLASKCSCVVPWQHPSWVEVASHTLRASVNSPESIVQYFCTGFCTIPVLALCWD